MKLQELFSVLPEASKDLVAAEARGLTQDARKVERDFVFVALRGAKADGHQFLGEAAARGAAALVVEDASRVPADFRGAVVVVPETRRALDRLCGQWNGHPTRSLYCVGITGTNGKTSLTYLIEHLFTSQGRPTGVIGTIDHHLGKRTWTSDMTTPDPVLLQTRLKEMKDAGASAVAMEVSSHALDQRRADSVLFDAAVFTNLTQDHLDYHKSFEDYFAAKRRLFSELLGSSPKTPRHAIIHGEDVWGARMDTGPGVTRWTFGEKTGDFRYHLAGMDFSSVRFRLTSPFGEVDVDFPMSGAHNAQNATAALMVACAAGFPLEESARVLAAFPGVPGRLQKVPNSRGYHVFIDYAHSPDALENVLSALGRVKAKDSKSRLWTVFGCGGDRDKSKRPLMAAAASKGSDFVVVTSDNPRTEEPAAIVEDILKGLSTSARKNAHVEIDRREALAWTFRQAAPGDVILIAGKGHEDYQIVGTTKLPFSDAEVASELLEKETP